MPFFMAIVFIFLFSIPGFSSVSANVRDSVKNVPSKGVSGVLHDTKGMPVMYASIALYRVDDQKPVGGTLSDTLGRFKFEKISTGNYYLKISQVGLEDLRTAVFKTNTEKVVYFGDLILKEATHQLGEVEISGKRAFVERKIDRTVVNVGNSALAAGGTVRDILQVAPGLSVDNDQISMKGKQGVIVMIDDRKVSLSAADLILMLENMPAGSVNQIELITTPSAKYDAEGKAGIINIKTKKGANEGWSGSVVSGFNIGTKPKFNESLLLNYKKGKINLFGDYTFTDSRNVSTYSSNKRISGDFPLLYDQNSKTNIENQGHNARVGLDYQPDKKNTIGFQADLNTSVRKKDQHQDVRYIRQVSNETDSAIASENTGRRTFETYTLNAHSRHQLGGKADILELNVDYLNYQTEDPNVYLNQYFDRTSALKRREHIRNDANGELRIVTGRADFTKTLATKTKIELGYKFSTSRSASDIRFNTIDDQGGIYVDPLRTNIFDYHENIHAGYVNFITSFDEATDLQVGLRGENTSYNGISKSTGEKINRNYFQFFPSLFLSRQFGELHKLGLAYSRRISRPDYKDLNPFINYSSPLFYTQGNPALLPETSHNVELNYTFDNALNFSAGYSKTKNYFTYFTSVADAETGATRQSIENFKDYDSWSFSLSYDKRFVKWWNFNGNFSVYHDQFKTPVQDSFIDMGLTTYDFNLLNSFTVTKALSFDLLALYRSAELGIARKFRPKSRIDFAGRYNLNKNLLIKMGVTDIFYSYLNRGTNFFGDLNGTFNNRNENRRFNVSLTYKFGGKSNSPRKKKSNEEEEQRIKD